MIRIRDLLTFKLSQNKNDDELIDNSVVLKENEEIYTLAYEELYKRNHKKVVQTLLYFIENDLYLRRNISKIIHDNSEESEYLMDEVTFSQHVELQSYYNSFRTTLISDIVTYLIESYNNVAKNIEDYDVAAMWYVYSDKVNEFYIKSLKHDLENNKHTDEHLIKLYREVIDAFEEVRKLSYRTMRRLMQHLIKATTGPRTLFIDSDLDT